MEIIRLNGNSMATKELTHAYLKWKLQLPDYYGENLDALWDILSVNSDPMTIYLYNYNNLIENLGNYGRSLIEVFKDAANENTRIKFIIKNNR